jgi:prepilin-type N-terminal cleavage/methylation domain-containing protein
VSGENKLTQIRGGKKAFTLIELLIVVAIIAILAAIAVPNFLEAQVRSKVSRVKADLRSMRTAIEAYAVDWNAYPMTVWPGYNERRQDPNQQAVQILPVDITTPVAYMTSRPSDPFAKGTTQRLDVILYTYGDLKTLRRLTDLGTLTPVAGMPGYVYIPGTPGELDSFEFYFGAYFEWSIGPAGPTQLLPNGSEVSFFQTYDATNGTVSLGHVFVTQKHTEPFYVPINSFP